MPVQVDDRGEAADAENAAKCTYNRYLTGGIDTMVLSAEVITTAQDCTGPGATPSGALVSDIRSSYDNNPFAYDGDSQQSPVLPKIGDVTLVQKASTASGASNAQDLWIGSGRNAKGVPSRMIL